MINISVESGASGIVISITGISGSSTANPGTVEPSNSVWGASPSSAAAGQDSVILIGPIVVPGPAGKASGESQDHFEGTGPGVTVIGPIVIAGSPVIPASRVEKHFEGTGPGVS